MYWILLGSFLLLTTILLSVYFFIIKKTLWGRNISFWYLIFTAIFIIIGSLILILVPFNSSHTANFDSAPGCGNSQDLAKIFDKY